MSLLPQPLTLRESDNEPDRLRALNEHSRAVVESIAQRPAVEYRDLEVDGGATDVDVELSGRVIAVTLAYVAEVDDPDADPPASLPGLHWRPIEGGARITTLYNLTGGTTYTVRLRIERG